MTRYEQAGASSQHESHDQEAQLLEDIERASAIIHLEKEYDEIVADMRAATAHLKKDDSLIGKFRSQRGH